MFLRKKLIRFARDNSEWRSEILQLIKNYFDVDLSKPTEKTSETIERLKGLFRKKKASEYSGNFRGFLIRVAYFNPELRAEILPLVVGQK